MKTFEIQVVFSCRASIDVEAATEEEAKQKVKAVKDQDLLLEVNDPKAEINTIEKITEIKF